MTLKNLAELMEFTTFAVNFGDALVFLKALKREPGENPGQTRCCESR